MVSEKLSGCKTKLYSKAFSSLAVLLLLAGVGFASTTSAPNTNDEAQHLMATAESLREKWSANELRQAKEEYARAALLWTSIDDYSNASRAILKAGDLCFFLSELREALTLYKQAALLGAKSGDHMTQGKALSQLGLVYSYMGDNDVAKKHLTKALALLKIAENDPDPTAKNNYGEAVCNMAEVIYSEGNFPRALDQFQDAERFFGDDLGRKAKVHLFVGRILGSLGDADQAQSEISEALKLYQGAKNKDGEGLALSALGQFQSFKGEQEQAIQLHNDALNIFVGVGDRLGEAIALNGLGQAQAKLNKPSLALSNYEKALSLVEDVGALDFVAVFTFKLAQFHLQAGKHEQALTYYQRCLKLSRAAKKVRNEANALSEIAIVYAYQGRPDEAVRQHRKVLEFYKTIGDRRGQATGLNKYGDFLLQAGQKQQALNKYLEALALSEAVDDKSIVLTSLYNLARAHHALGNFEAALPFVERALDISEGAARECRKPRRARCIFLGRQKVLRRMPGCFDATQPGASRGRL